MYLLFFIILFCFFFVIFFFFFFFFSSRRRHTRSLRDWSSDVCSSDLIFELLRRCCHTELTARSNYDWCAGHCHPVYASNESPLLSEVAYTDGASLRSEERRVGKECRSGWWQEH